MDVDALPVAEFAFPGPLRDRLVAAILSGAKTSTTGLLQEYDEGLPPMGKLEAVVDSAQRRVAVIEITGVEVVALRDVPFEHVLAEGEGHESVAQWRPGHERFWHSAPMRAELGDPHFTVHDGTEVVLERFRVVHRS